MTQCPIVSTMVPYAALIATADPRMGTKFIELNDPATGFLDNDLFVCAGPAWQKVVHRRRDLCNKLTIAQSKVVKAEPILPIRIPEKIVAQQHQLTKHERRQADAPELPR